MTDRDSYPLSYGQRALWFLQRLSPQSTAYNFVFAARVSPRPDPGALRRSLTSLVRRHASLRTTYALQAGRPVQTVGPDPDFDFEHLETAAWDLEALGRQAADEAYRPFDLESGPVMRVRLFSGPADESLLLLVVHHIAIDFHSLALLLEELGALYRAEVSGVSASLPPALRYVDFTNWQHELLAESESERLWAYWRRRLSGSLPVLPLPLDRERPAALTYRGASVDVTLEPDLVRQLKLLCASGDATLSTLLLTAFQVLLYRYTDQRDVLVGCPVSGRPAEFERVVGYMVNTVVIRSSLAGGPSFRRLLSDVQRTVADGLAHQHYPFPLLVERLQPDRHSGISPVFQCLFALHDPGAQSLVPLMFGQSGMVANLGGLALTSFQVEQRSAMMDLSLLMVDAGPSVTATWQYNTDLFDRSTVEAMARSYEVLLRDVVAAPDRRISELRLLADEDGAAGPAALAATRRSRSGAEPLLGLIDGQTRRRPVADAVTGNGRPLTYKALTDSANRLAHHLRRHGVGPEAVVSLQIAACPQLPVAILAILKAGGAILTVDPAAPDPTTGRLPVPGFAVRLPGHARPPVDAGTQVIDLEAAAAAIAECPPEAPDVVVAESHLALVPADAALMSRGALDEICAALAAPREGTERSGAWTLGDHPDVVVLQVLAALTQGAALDLGRRPHGSPGRLSSRPSRTDLDFGLFYFASDEGAGERRKYRLLMEGAKFADRYGLSAVWTPERHFHAFGGLYPNPSVTSAAVAACTKRVGIRAGSVVLPLHNPVRVAEEWSVVDNLSDGRVGVAFASGWNEDDFVLAPENHADRKEIMVRSIDVVRRLWRGDAVTLPGTRGRSLPIAIKPRPIQAELPIWLAAFGNPATFRLAGRIGANVLTHLVGQSTRELARKIGVYREALRASGLEAQAGQVTVMLHTFLGEDLGEVREQVREPFIHYLKTNVDQARELAVSTGRGVDATRYGDEDVHAYLEAVFARYFGSRSLLGTPASCQAILDELAAIGVTEIACLVDFGVEEDLVLQSLGHLTTLMDQRRAVGPAAARTGRWGSPPIRPALLWGLLDLAPWLAAAPPAKPPADGPAATWPAASGMAGTAAGPPLYVLDPLLRPLPAGAVGELYLGGDCVPRGYAGRPRLTAERFLADPLSHRLGARLFAVGRRARRRADGSLELVATAATEPPDPGPPAPRPEHRDPIARALVTEGVEHRVRARRASIQHRRPSGGRAPTVQPEGANE